MNESQVLKQHEARIRSAAVRYAKSETERDDMIQEGRIALIKALRAWNVMERHVSSFWTYARKWVHHAMVDFCDARPRETVTDDIDTIFDRCGETPETDLIRLQEERVNHRNLEAARRALTPREVSVLEKRFEKGESWIQVAFGEGLGLTSVQNIEERALNKLAIAWGKA